jgi:hypothetical protein
MDTTAMVQNCKFADHQQEGVTAAYGASNGFDWLPTLTTCEYSSVHPAGSVAKKNRTQMDLSGSSRVAESTQALGSWLRSPGA